MRRSAFTLVELLVVIGIIAVLIAILMPVLNRVREAANQIKCLSNLRQVGMAIISYTNENKGFLPSSTADPVAPRPEDWVWWEASRNPNNFEYAIGSVIPYLGGRQNASLGGSIVPAAVLRCPSDDVRTHITPYPYSYSVNWDICRRMGPGYTDPDSNGHVTSLRDRPIRISQVVAPSKKILAIDESGTTIDDGCWAADNYTSNAAFGANCLSDRHTMREENSHYVGPIPTFRFSSPPTGRGNVVYCDGHADFVARWEAWDSYSYRPELNPDADPLIR